MLKKIIIAIVLNGLALYGVTQLVPGISYAGGVAFFIVGGIIMGVLNTFIKPLLKLVTLPLQILTLGISLIFLNAFLFWIFEGAIGVVAVEGVMLTIAGIKGYFLAGVVFGMINWLLNLIVK